MEQDDARCLRLAIDLTRQARAGGADPFGAALVRDGVVVHQVADRCLELSDPTHHAELGAISEYCRAARQFSLSDVTLYSSAEPCPMCAGAIHWARISRVVFSVSQAMLQECSGGRPKPACAAILQALGSGAEVVGPLLVEEGLAVFVGYAFVPKAVRHAARVKEPGA